MITTNKNKNIMKIQLFCLNIIYTTKNGSRAGLLKRARQNGDTPLFFTMTS